MQQIVTDAGVLAASVRQGDTEEALFRASRIAAEADVLGQPDLTRAADATVRALWMVSPGPDPLRHCLVDLAIAMDRLGTLWPL